MKSWLLKLLLFVGEWSRQMGLHFDTLILMEIIMAVYCEKVRVVNHTVCLKGLPVPCEGTEYNSDNTHWSICPLLWLCLLVLLLQQRLWQHQCADCAFRRAPQGGPGRRELIVHITVCSLARVSKEPSFKRKNASFLLARLLSVSRRN